MFLIDMLGGGEVSSGVYTFAGLHDPINVLKHKIQYT